MGNEADFILKKNAKESMDILLNKVETSVPAMGAFEDTCVSFESSHPGYPGDVELTVGAWVKPAGNSSDQNWKTKRYLEVKVYSPDGESDSSQWIYNGSKDGILDYLRDSSKVEDIFNAIKDGVENIRRHFTY